MVGSRSALRPILPLYLVVFIAVGGYTLMVTLYVPLLMHDYGLLASTASTAQRTVTLGLLLAAYPLGQFLGSPVLGALSDRYGRKPIIGLALCATLLCYGLVALAIERASLSLLIAASFITGTSESNTAIAQSAIADVSTREERGRLFGYVTLARSMAFVVMPLIGGQLAEAFGFATPFWAAMAPLVLAIGWVVVAFRETHAPQAGQPIRIGHTFAGLATVFTDRPLRRLYLISFLCGLGIFGFYRCVLIYMTDEWRMPAGRSTLVYSYLAAVGVFANLFCMGPLSRRFGLRRVAVAAAALGGLSTIAIVVPESERSLWFTTGPANFFVVLVFAASAAILSNAVGGDRQGRVMGNNQALMVVAETLSASAGGALAAIWVPLPLIAAGALFLLAALLLASLGATHLGSLD